MKCPACGADTTVTDTKSEGLKVTRRRKCLACPRRFMTIEEPTSLPVSINRSPPYKRRESSGTDHLR